MFSSYSLLKAKGEACIKLVSNLSRQSRDVNLKTQTQTKNTYYYCKDMFYKIDPK